MIETHFYQDIIVDLQHYYQLDFDIRAETPVQSAVFERIRHRKITRNADL